ncbi:hypothetical protein FJ957_19765 [Mesorhizobium sp. B2-4-6]|nr:hypothetical protein FJ957_19765 [Mesorhizobium sp. B2-4-6]
MVRTVSAVISGGPTSSGQSEQFQEKCLAVFRPELRKQKSEQFQEKCLAVFRPELRKQRDRAVQRFR